jgi:hypothetical protein
MEEEEEVEEEEEAPNDKVTMDNELERCGRKRSQQSLEYSLNICLQVLKETTTPQSLVIVTNETKP